VEVGTTTVRKGRWLDGDEDGKRIEGRGDGGGAATEEKSEASCEERRGEATRAGECRPVSRGRICFPVKTRLLQGGDTRATCFLIDPIGGRWKITVGKSPGSRRDPLLPKEALGSLWLFAIPPHPPHPPTHLYPCLLPLRAALPAMAIATESRGSEDKASHANEKRWVLSDFEVGKLLGGPILAMLI